MKSEQEELQKKLADLDKKMEGLVEEKKLLETDPEYLEKVVRQELGLVKPGEVVYKFVEEPPSGIASSPTASAPRNDVSETKRKTTVIARERSDRSNL